MRNTNNKMIAQNQEDIEAGDLAKFIKVIWVILFLILALIATISASLVIYLTSAY